MNKKKTVLVSGHFNVLHPGHLRLLRFAKECGDRLVVAVQSDRMAGNSAHVPEKFRLEGVQSNSWVDEAFIIDEPVTHTISRLHPDIVVKGKEHESLFNPELAVLAEYGGRLLFSSGETVFSSLDLLRKEFYESDPRSISLPQDYLVRHCIQPERLAILLQKFPSLKVCVVGDLIVDEYITCQPLGMSQEDPTIVVTPVDSIRFVGGAGIVAAHAAGLGASVQFVTVAGADDTRDLPRVNWPRQG
ncbi:MAG: Bifunctional protein HldE [Syntrophus sp. SKADARSKE-3]|nr:Bifunctional protein HldE [Syntrophus sp. SKADARSKE-3]